jgi:hypothetical protein
VAVQVHAVEQTLDALHSAVLESVEKQFYNGEPVATLDVEAVDPLQLARCDKQLVDL